MSERHAPPQQDARTGSAPAGPGPRFPAGGIEPHAADAPAPATGHAPRPTDAAGIKGPACEGSPGSPLALATPRPAQANQRASFRGLPVHARGLTEVRRGRQFLMEK